MAILVSAVTFGVYHGNLSRFYATALGAILPMSLKTNRVQFIIYISLLMG